MTMSNVFYQTISHELQQFGSWNFARG